MPRTHKYGMLAITLCGSLTVAAVAQQSPYPVAQNDAVQAPVIQPPTVIPTPGAGNTLGATPAPGPTPIPDPAATSVPMTSPLGQNGIPLAPPPLMAQPTPAPVATPPALTPAPFSNAPGPVVAMPAMPMPQQATGSMGCGSAGCGSNGCTSGSCGDSGCGSSGCGQNSCNYKPIYGKLSPYCGSCNTNKETLIDKLQKKFKGGLLGKMKNGNCGSGCNTCGNSNGCSNNGSCFDGSCFSKLGGGSCLNGSCFGKLGSGSCLNGSCLSKLGSGSCLSGGCGLLGGGAGGGCGFASLCGSKGYPDKGWAPPASVPIIRNNAEYSRYWPEQWYGSPGFAATPSPMVFMPTDTTQLGFGYQQVPFWRRTAASYPPIPDPAMYHTRTGAMRAPYGYPLLYQPIMVPHHTNVHRNRTGWSHASTQPATNSRQQVAQRQQPTPRMSPEQVEHARQYQAAVRRNAAINARPVSSSSPR